MNKKALFYSILRIVYVCLLLPLIAGCSEDSADTGVDIFLNKDKLVLEKGKGERLIASFNPVDAKNQGHVWSSGNSQVATVDETGYVTAIALGEAVIAAKALDGDDIATCNVTVVDKIIPVSSVSLNKSECYITVGENVALSATINPSNATNKDVIWESNNEGIVTVDNAGVVTALAIGEATITVKTNDAEKTATCNVSVVAKGVKFTQPVAEIVTSNSVYISGIITPLGVETNEMGICYTTTPNPTIDDDKVIFNNGDISHIIKGLEPETAYYIRFYAIADGTVRYSDQTIFETLTAVDIPTPEFSNVTSNSAVISGVINANGSVIKETGIVYSQSSSPTVDDNKILISNENISYTLFNLDANTTYFVRLYAIVGEKVYYGAESELLTNEALITNFKAVVIGENEIDLVSDAPRGYGNVGVCYGTSPNPKVTDNTAEATLGADGKLHLTISGLYSRNPYYLRSYYKQGNGFVYSDDEICVQTIFKIKASNNLYDTYESPHVVYSQSWSGYTYKSYSTISYKNFPEGIYKVYSSASKGGLGWQDYGYTKYVANYDDLNKCTKTLEYISGGNGTFYHTIKKDYWSYYFVDTGVIYYINIQCIETGTVYKLAWEYMFN